MPIHEKQRRKVKGNNVCVCIFLFCRKLYVQGAEADCQCGHTAKGC